MNKTSQKVAAVIFAVTLIICMIIPVLVKYKERRNFNDDIPEVTVPEVEETTDDSECVDEPELEPEPEPDISEENENELIEQALLANATKIDNVKITYYCAEKYPHICGTGDGLTSTGLKIQPGVVCAVDPKVIPYGSDVILDYGDGELHYYRAEDCGGAIKGHKIDICVATHKEALKLGRAKATVYYIPEGTIT